jgi:hypothetical protein
MAEEHEGTWDGSLPEFEMGPYLLDDYGMFRRDQDYGVGPQENDYLEPSPTLCRWLMYNQRGCCLECGIPEWAIKTKLHAHSEKPGGLYSIWNTVLLCPTCHRKWHSEHRQKERPAPQQSARRRRVRRRGARRTRKNLLERLQPFMHQRTP